MRLVKTVVFLTAFIVPTILVAQHEDCDLAQVICSDGPVVFNSDGAGINDFQDPGNHPGCLITNENQSSWYYFEFTPDMPPNSMIEFTIEPNGGFTEDYDFAIYGPNVPCDDLDFPVRCSFANFECDLCPLTGMGMGATDNSEGAQGEDGFVAPLEVQPGEGYYLILDNWYGSSDGFTLTWGGSAAAFLNCNANPMCNNLSVNAGVDLNVCAGDSLVMSASLSNASPNATVVWRDTTGASLWLSDTTSLQPTFFPPNDFNGVLSFTVVVTDGECQKTDQVTIGVDPIPEVTIIGDSLHCPNTNAILDGGAGFTAYQWSNDSTTQITEIDTAGIFWLAAQDANGCIGSDTLVVEEAMVELPEIQGMTEICQGDSAILSLNTEYEFYEWNDGSTDSTYTAFDADNYSVTVTDVNNCMSEALFSLVVNALPQPAILGNDTICEGEFATLEVLEDYASYLWSNGMEDSTIVVDSEGNYSLTVTDEQGCSGEDSFVLAVNDAPVPNVLVGPIFCPGDSTPIRLNDGYVSYLWSNGDMDNVAYAQQGGIFSVTVTDENACEGTLDIEVDQYPAPVPVIIGDTVFCEGEAVSLSSSQTFPEYLWSDGSTSSEVIVDSPGIVSLTVTDQNDCQATTSVNLEMNPLPVFNISGDAFYCENDSTLLTVEAGFMSYLWSDSSQDTFLYVDNPGVYELTVTDVNGCQEEASIDITENALPEPQITGALSFCPGTSTTLATNTAYSAYLWSDGSQTPTLEVTSPADISVTVTDANNCQGIAVEVINQYPDVILQIDGDTAYCATQSTILDAGNSFEEYLWSDNSMQSTLEISNPGTYGLTVTDTNGCQGEESVNVIENPLPNPQIQGGSGYCPGETITLSTLQGWVTYQWSNGLDDPNIMVNTPGLYVVTVSDINGCMAMVSQNVVAFPEPDPQIEGDLQFCPETETILTVNNSYLSYLWSDNSSGSSLTVQITGPYSLTITDDNGCSASTMVEVSNFEVFAPEIPAISGFCAGQSILVNAGENYQSYLWSDGTMDAELEIDQAGTYGVSVVDQNDCESFTEFNVEEYQLPQPDIQSVEGLCPGEGTTLSVNESFVSYLWSDGSQEPELAIGTPGVYQLVVSDDNGCEGMDEVDILAYQNPDPQILGFSEICPGDTTHLTLSETYVAYSWTGGIEAPNLSVSLPGTIEVQVENEQGCLGQTSLDIIGLSAPEFEISGDTTFCSGGSTLLSVPDQFTNYQWSPSGNFPELQVDQPGTYSVTVTNGVGCSTSQIISVAEIELPQPEVGTNQTMDCEIRSVTIGGTNPLPPNDFTYIWSGPGIDAVNQNDPQPEVDMAGPYRLIVEDLTFGCLSEEYEIEVFDLMYEPAVDIALAEQLNCLVETTPLDGSASENRPTIQYHWYSENGLLTISDEAVIEVANGGWYYLEVLDTLTKCQAIDSLFVEEDREYPTLQLDAPGILNCYISTLQLDGQGSSIGAEFSYDWSSPDGSIVQGENTLTPTVDAPGWYIFSVQNESNECISVDSILVQQDIEPPIASAGSNQVLDCIVRELMLDGSASSIGPIFRYHWADETGTPLPQANLLQPQVNQEGIYYLTVTNIENGCTNTDEVQIAEEAEYPSLTDFSLVHPTCFGESTGQIMVNTVESGSPPYLYALNDQGFSAEGNFLNLPAGTYDLSIEDVLGCAITIPIVIEEGSRIQIELGEDQRINLGETLEIRPILTQPGIGAVQYQWHTVEGDSCQHCDLIQLRPFESQDVEVVGTDEQGCTSTDILTIFVAHPDEVYIPNAFSPNNDGINDQFMVYSGEDVSRIRSILILDRWGGYIFEAFDLAPNEESSGWDGKIGGQLAMPSVFAYLIEVEFIDGDTKVFKGDVTLIR